MSRYCAEEVLRLRERGLPQVADPHPPEALEQLLVDLLQAAQVRSREQHAGGHVGTHDPLGVAGAEGDRVLAQGAAQPLGDLRHHAEIHEDDLERPLLPAGGAGTGAPGAKGGLAADRQRAHEEVSRMGVGVHEASARRSAAGRSGRARAPARAGRCRRASRAARSPILIQPTFSRVSVRRALQSQKTFGR